MTDSSSGDIIDSIDIVEEVSKFVQLKPHKNEMIGLCPFHTEDTPSFYVNPQKQLFFCFGCQTGGNIISFRAKISGLNNRDAVLALAQDYNIKLSAHTSDKRTIHSMLLSVANYYHQQLDHCSDATLYLKKRHLDIDTIKYFNIGYAPSEWRNITPKLPNYDEKKAIDVGIKIKSAKGSYDRFRHRIMFPIRSHYGDVVGFGGRSLGDEKPKYINSSDSEVFHKGQVLYGLYEAIQDNIKSLLVVEGYMDVIRLYQSGIKGGVASLGTAFTESHFLLAAKYADHLIFCFDGDEAGEKAALKSLDSILPHLRDQVSCSFILMPKGEDPDSYIDKNGPGAFKALIDQSLTLSNLIMYELTKHINHKTLEGQAQRIRFIHDYTNKMPNSILKSLIHKEIGTVTSPPPPLNKKPLVHSMSDDSKMIELVFAQPDLINQHKDLLADMAAMLPERVNRAIECILNNNISLARFLSEQKMPGDSIVPQLRDSNASISKELSDLLNYFREKTLEGKISVYMQKAALGDLESQNILSKLLQLKHQYKKNKIILEIDEYS